MNDTLAPAPAWLQDAVLLSLRLLIAAIFATSGWSHLTKSAERAASIGMSPGFTKFLGAAELAGALGVGFGVLAQPAAAGLILVMLGAVQKKVFVWHTGIWGPHGTDGWHYELTMIAMNAVVAAFGPGRWALWK